MTGVTVVIPSFNAAGTLSRAIESALDQRGVEVSVVVVDDGSTDDTFEVSTRCGARYLGITHTGRPGVVRNAGVRVASGPYIAFLDADDAWLPGKLARQVEILAAAPEVVLCATNALAERGGRVHGAYIGPTVESGRIGLEQLAGANPIVCSTVVARLDALRDVGRFDEGQLLCGVEDYDLWLRLASVGEVEYVAEPFAVYRDEPAESLRGRMPRAQSTMGRLAALSRAELRLPVGDARAEAVRAAALACTTELTRLQSPPGGLGGRLRRRFGRGRGEARTGGLRLHLGCGETVLRGYLNIDLPPQPHTVQRSAAADLYADLRDLSFPAGAVDEIVVRHVLEHFDRVTGLRLLAEWHRWLSPGGLLVVETPDLRQSLQAFMAEPDVVRQQVALRHLFGSQEADWALHRDGWYAEKYALVLDALGYDLVSTEATEWQGTHNLEVQAIRRDGEHDAVGAEAAVRRIAGAGLVDDSPSERRLLDTWLGGGAQS